MPRLPRRIYGSSWDSEHVEWECQREVFAVGRAMRDGRMSRRDFNYALRDLAEIRAERRR